MATLQDCFTRTLQKFVNQCWVSYGAAGASSTYTLYRRATAGATDDLGVPNDPWTIIATGLIGTWCGIKIHKEGDFELANQGQIQYLIYEMYTTHLDIKPGDNIRLDLTGLAYGVEAVERQGPLNALVLDHASAQIEV